MLNVLTKSVEADHLQGTSSASCLWSFHGLFVDLVGFFVWFVDYFFLLCLSLSLRLNHAWGRLRGALLLISTEWYTISSLHIWTNILQENHYVGCANSPFDHEHCLPQASIEYSHVWTSHCARSLEWVWAGSNNCLQGPALVSCPFNSSICALSPRTKHNKAYIKPRSHLAKAVSICCM